MSRVLRENSKCYLHEYSSIIYIQFNLMFLAAAQLKILNTEIFVLNFVIFFTNLPKPFSRLSIGIYVFLNFIFELNSHNIMGLSFLAPVVHLISASWVRLCHPQSFHLDCINHVRAIHITIRDATNFSIIRPVLMTYSIFLAATVLAVTYTVNINH